MKNLALFVAATLLLFSAQNLSAQCCSKDGKKEAKVESAGAPYKAALNKKGIQEATILVKNGYHPDRIVAKKGVPLRLVFDLQEKSCTNTVIFKDLDRKKDLVYKKKTPFEFTPDTAGSFGFACPMEMFKGTLIVED